MKKHWSYFHPYVYTVVIWVMALISYLILPIAAYIIFVTPYIVRAEAWLLEFVTGWYHPIKLSKYHWKLIRADRDRKAQEGDNGRH